MRIEAVLGDICTEEVDAVVNAANRALAGGGGVDGAIHRAAGTAELHRACAGLGGCEPGDAKATPGYALPARWIIHTVGPVWQGGDHREAEVLASCYRRSLEVADELGARSVAFPAISTGVYGYPSAQAAEVAVTTLQSVSDSASSSVELVRLVAFDQGTYELYRRLLDAGTNRANAGTNRTNAGTNRANAGGNRANAGGNRANAGGNRANAGGNPS